jgi:hypothetical protein
MGSALLNTTTGQELAGREEHPAPAGRAHALRPGLEDRPLAPASADALRTQVAQRLAAHRRRRESPGAAQADSILQADLAGQAAPAGSRSARIAATVAERYARTPSYRAVLAAEAERATQQARAAAEVAALNAQAIAAAQQRLLQAFDESERRAAAEASAAEASAAQAHHAEQEARFAAEQAARLEPAPNLWPDLEPDAAGRLDAAGCLDAAGYLAAAGRAERSSRRPKPDRPAPSTPHSDSQFHSAPAASSAPSPQPPGGLTVRLHDDAVRLAAVDLAQSNYRTASPPRPNLREPSSEAEASALDEEIAFRQAPVFEEPAGPAIALPANLIEFPRHLVASRKARPRYAEGPLREESEAAPLDGQLRIFEVDPAQISTDPAAGAESPDAVSPQWASLWLETPGQKTPWLGTPNSTGAPLAQGAGAAHAAEPAADSDLDAAAEPVFRAAPPVQPASLGRRALAGAINACIVFTGMAAFAGVFVAIAGRSLAWDADAAKLHALRELGASVITQTGLQPAQIGTIAAVAAGFLLLTYYALFFWFSVATPGMRSARVGLCTFEDDNPTRRAVRRRLGAMLLSAASLGFGFAWAALDEDKLTWHDRITRMYLRSY